MRTLFIAVGTLCLATSVAAQTWCGKNYMASSPIVPPGGAFPVPATSQSPLLALRCAPSLRPYLPEDAATSPSLIIDTIVTFSQITGAAPINLPHPASPADALMVSATIDGTPLAHGTVPLNATKSTLPFSLATLRPRAAPYNVTCTASFRGQTFRASTALAYLPAPAVGAGSVTKMDLRTGALLARPAGGDGRSGAYALVFPIGFYTDFGYLARNLSVLNELKAQGFTVVHPTPPFDNQTALDLVLDRMQEVGLYLMYDMRYTYMNTTSVTAQVKSIKSRPNLLLWYTGDEPDGTSDPLIATVAARGLINELDGHHPVALVLNCFDYYWADYTAGADIVMQDTYMLGNNVSFSSQWGTPCTPDYGDCGCDDCAGEFEDISRRMDVFAERLVDDGWEREKAVWTVPQAFGNDTYWKRYPTGSEYIVQSVLGINHGALGVVAWNDPTTPEIKASASLLAAALPAITPFIFSHAASFAHVAIGRVDAAMWTVGAQTLVLATNLNYANATLAFADLHLSRIASVSQVLDSGARRVGDALAFGPVGTGAFVFKTA